jgi:2-hydroxychromene-2-carboxylate isomerase
VIAGRKSIMTPDQQATSADIEFWFDFASGYAYFAVLEIEALAARHYRSVLWRPFCLGSALKITGSSGLSRTPLKGDYARRDWQRLARLKSVAFSPGEPSAYGLAGIAGILRDGED